MSATQPQWTRGGSIARLVRWMLLAELGGYALLGVAGHIALGIPVGLLVILGLGIALAGRCGYVVIAYQLARYLDDTDTLPNKHKRSVLGLLLVESAALTLTFTVLVPFAASLWRPRPIRNDHGGEPIVVLVHGYCCNAAYWLPLYWRLRRQGIAVAPPPTLEPPFSGINAQADSLAEYLASLCRKAPEAPLVLVGHSMGGLIIRACYARHGLPQVERIVTLGTPHHGSQLAHLGWSKNARQMRPGSDWLQALNGHQLNPGPPLIAIAASADELVIPFVSALPYFSENKYFSHSGHLALGWNWIVREHIASDAYTTRRFPS